MKKKTDKLSEHFQNPIKVVERGKIDITNTQIHERSLYWLGHFVLFTTIYE